MHIIRFTQRASGDVGIGVRDEHSVQVISGVPTMSALLRLPIDELKQLCNEPGGPTVSVDDVTPLPPVDERMEVWAAGVTYTVSRAERVAESQRSATVYEQVYDAERPELFFKAPAWRVVTDGQPIAIREDSDVDVPEPEMAAVVAADGSVVGYLVCNDVSSRHIERENPLYLPQAKVYDGSCALSSGIRPVWEVEDPYRLAITMSITRDGDTVWEGTANTKQLHRQIPDLVHYLGRATHFPDGAVLATGTCLVPHLPFTLAPSDRVAIEIDDVGTLGNHVVRGRDQMAWRHATEGDTWQR